MVLATFRNEENEQRNIDIISSVLESIFTVDFVLCFFKEFLGPDISSTGDKPYSTVAEITQNYLEGAFFYDFVPLVPL